MISFSTFLTDGMSLSMSLLSTLLVAPAALLSPSPYLRRGPGPLRAATEAVAKAYFALKGADLPREGQDIAVLASPGRGKGLFACRCFEAGEVVAVYSGVIATYSDYVRALDDELTSGDYVRRFCTKNNDAPLRA